MKGMKHVFLDFGPINGPKRPKWAKTAKNPHFWPKNETTIKITFNHQKCTRFGLCSWFCPIFWPGGQKWPFLDFFYSKVDFTFWDLQRGITITRDQVWMIRSTFWKSFDPTQPPKKIQLVLGTFVVIKFFKVFSPIWAVLIRYQIRLQKWLCIHMFWHQNQSEWCKTIFFPKLIVAVMLKMVQNGPKKALKWPEIVKNPKKPKKRKETSKIPNKLAIFFKKSPILGVVCSFLDIFGTQNPHFWAKNPKKCIFQVIVKICAQNSQNRKILLT